MCLYLLLIVLWGLIEGARPLIVTSTFSGPSQWPNLERQASLMQLTPPDTVWIVVENGTTKTRRNEDIFKLSAQWFEEVTQIPSKLKVHYISSEEPDFENWWSCPQLRGWNAALDYISRGNLDLNDDQYVLFFLPEHATVLPHLLSDLQYISKAATWNVGRLPFVELGALDVVSDDMSQSQQAVTFNGWIDPTNINGPPLTSPYTPLHFAVNIKWLAAQEPDIAQWKWTQCNPGSEIPDLVDKFGINLDDYQILHLEEVLVWDSWTAPVRLTSRYRQQALLESKQHGSLVGSSLYSQIIDWKHFWMS